MSEPRARRLATEERDAGLRFTMPPVPFLDIVITDPYGERENHPVTGGRRLHDGVDIRAPQDTVQLAVMDGYELSGRSDGCGDFVAILHSKNNKVYRSRYCHLDANSIAELRRFRVGSGNARFVSAGTAIGKSGTSGGITYPHQHFEFHRIEPKRNSPLFTQNTSVSIPSSERSFLPPTQIDLSKFNADQLFEIAFGETSTRISLDPEVFLVELTKLGWVDSVTRKDGSLVLSDRNTRQVHNTSNVIETGTVSPYITTLQSFHPNIQYELTRRRISAETVNTYMPFVRLTSLTNVLGKNMAGAPETTLVSWCPSLGIHGEDEITFKDMYTPQDLRSTIGYATTEENGVYKRVPVLVETPDKDALNIPIPGITEMNLERGTAGPMGVRGGLMRVNLRIRAYSVGQVDALLRYFLRPATRVVLEIGRQSSNPAEQLTLFNWRQNRTELSNLFKELLVSKDAQTKFLEDYVYKNYGNYEIFLGYVVKFNLKYNKDNVYEIDLNIHSVQQFEIPTTHTGVKSFCSDSATTCKAVDVREYFSKEQSYKPNSFTALMKHTEDSPEWQPHVIEIQTSTEPSEGVETEYYVSWRFFVEKILNDSQYGILGLITDEQTREFLRNGLLRPTKIPTEGEINRNETDENLVANEVGYHPDLRSTDPNVMIIYNQTAQGRRSPAETKAFEAAVVAATSGSSTTSENRVTLEDYNANTTIQNSIVNNGIVGSFRNIRTPSETTRAAAGNLMHGIWLNTTAIKEVFSQSDTVTVAIDALLERMNTATEGYWNLQLYSSERPNPGQFVVDMGLSKKIPSLVNPLGDLSIDPEPVESGVPGVLTSIQDLNLPRFQHSPDSNKPKYIYMFNRGTKVLSDGEFGSDILDLNVEFNLPQVIAVQAIAGVGGPAQKSTLQSIDIPELNQISLIGDIFAPCYPAPNPTCGGEVCPPGGPAAEALAKARAEVDRLLRQLDFVTDVNTRSRTLFGGGEAFPLRVPLIRAYRAEEEAVNFYNNVIQNPELFSSGVDKIRKLTNLGRVLELVEFSPSRMIKRLNIDSRNVEEGRPAPYAHSFNSSNLTKTIVSVTLPGIGGIELFQAFLVDRVPSILERGFYVVTKVTHKFSVERGWTTTVEGRFRFRPDGEDKTSGTYSLPCEGTTPTLASARTPSDFITAGNPNWRTLY
jgi:hypothetical protein